MALNQSFLNKSCNNIKSPRTPTLKINTLATIIP